ncbi:MAG: efflux RND transporter permease subunit [Pseudomonadota bacterium]
MAAPGDPPTSMSDRGGLPGLSVRRPFLAAVMNLMIMVAGISAIFGLEVRELPDIDRPIVSVRANFPGASPTTVDAEVTSIVEGAVARVEGVVNVASSSEEGNFRMRIEFRPDRDLNSASNDVREAVNRIARELPDGVEDLFVVKSDRDSSPVMQIAVWSDTEPVDEITRRIEDEIIPELTSIDGVADVVLFGERRRVIRVALSPRRLAAFGFSVAEVMEVVRAAQFDVPVGSFEAGDLEVLVRADASVVDPELIQELRLREDVRLGDVADIYFGHSKAESDARLDGRRVVVLGVVRQSQSNTVAISEGVRSIINRIDDRFHNLNIQIIVDDAVFIRGAINEVITTLGLALLIVVAVIWAFLGRLGTTLIPAVTIPIALIGVLGAIWLLGFSINLITLLALVLATGLVVDDAIVVTENIQRRRAEGIGARAAAVIGTRQVFFAVIATTITLIAVFLPISFLPSDAGRLFAEFGIVLGITVALSSFVALTVCPMIASRLSDLGGDGLIRRGIGRGISVVYGWLLWPALKAPLIFIFLASLLAATSLTVYGDLGEELVPREDRGRVVVRLQGPDGTGLAYTDRQVEAVENLIAPFAENGTVESVYSITGRFDPNRGEISAQLIPWSERDVGQLDIEAAIKEDFANIPGAQVRIRSINSLSLRRGSDGGISIALTGPTYPEIAEAADVFAERMAEIDGISGIRIQYQATQPQLGIGIDRARASHLGVAMSELSETLSALIDEDEVGELTVKDQAVPIIVQSQNGAIRDPSDLLNLYVRSDQAELVALSQLITFEETGVAAELDRHGQKRAIEIDGALAPELSLREAVEQIEALAREILPPDIGLLLRGEAEALDETSNAVTTTYIIALIIIFLVLVGQFESITSALVIMVTVPFGVCAAVYALWLTGTTINIYSQIGVLMLIGIMAKNGILLVEFADQLRERGFSVTDAAREAAVQRLRAIAMTLASTVLAGLPLILSTGPGAEARTAIGWVVFGGLGLAAAFTLFLTPAAYALIAGLSKSRIHATNRLDEELEQARASQRGPAE